MKSLHSSLILFSICCSLIGADDVTKTPAPTSLDWSTANRSSLTIDVQEKERGKMSSDSFKTDYGSYDKSETRFRTIDISVRNSSPKAIKVTSEVIFFSVPERAPKSRIVQQEPKIEERDIAPETLIAPLKTYKFDSTSIVDSRKMRLEAIGESYSGGSKVAGWAVVVRDGAKVIAYKTSNATIERMITQQQGASIKAALLAYGEPEPEK